MFFLQGFRVPIIVSCKSGNGIKFLLKTSINDDHFRSAFLDNLEEWESNVTAQFVNSIRLDASIIDVGAYSGVFSILGAKVGAKRIIAIEPNGRVFPLLEENIRINSLENYVRSLDSNLLTGAGLPFKLNYRLVGKFEIRAGTGFAGIPRYFELFQPNDARNLRTSRNDEKRFDLVPPQTLTVQ